MDKTAMKTLLEQVMLKLMGSALDCGRMAITQDRQFKQFERSVRQECRALINDGQKLIDQASEQPESK
jgi:hypothetical protein